MQFGTENDIQFTQPVEDAGTWNQFQADFRRSGYLSNGVSGSDLNQQQNTLIVTGIPLIDWTAVSDNNQIFVSTSLPPNGDDSTIDAITIDGSNKNWSQSISPVSKVFLHGTCAPIGDVIFTIGITTELDDLSFVIFDKATGNQLDSSDIEGVTNEIIYRFFLIQNELAYADTGNEDPPTSYSEVNPSTLIETSLIDPPGVNSLESGVAHTEDNIIVNGEDGLRKYDLSGSLIDTTSTSNDIESIVISLNDNVVYANKGGLGSAIDIDTLNTIWTSSSISFSFISTDENNIYVSAGSTLFKVDKNDGSTIDSVSLDASNLSYPAITSDTIYVANTHSGDSPFDPGLIALNKNDLSQIFKHSLPENNGRLCVTESSVAVLSNQNDEIYTIT